MNEGEKKEKGGSHCSPWRMPMPRRSQWLPQHRHHVLMCTCTPVVDSQTCMENLVPLGQPAELGFRSTFPWGQGL